jgi:hypothetical protein
MVIRLHAVVLPLLLGMTSCSNESSSETSESPSSEVSNTSGKAGGSVPTDGLENSEEDAISTAETAADAADKLIRSSNKHNTAEDHVLPIAYRECKRLLDALEAKHDQPSWHLVFYSNGKPAGEGKKINGVYYELEKASWIKKARNALESEHLKVIFYLGLIKDSSPMASLQSVKVSDCKTSDPIEIDGEKLNVITYNRQVPSNQELFQSVRGVARMYIGVNDGLPHRIEYGAASDHYYVYTYADSSR